MPRTVSKELLGRKIIHDKNWTSSTAYLIVLFKENYGNVYIKMTKQIFDKYLY